MSELFALFKYLNGKIVGMELSLTCGNFTHIVIRKNDKIVADVRSATPESAAGLALSKLKDFRREYLRE